ncbi:MAG: formylglycine-generating enzyme family protein [Desulfobacula sp.]|nr:formylglycine-generating enzyme family protein [Desulfobacula sp.]
MANISITLDGIDQAIAGLTYKEGSVKAKAVMAIRSFYVSEDAVKNLNAIDADTLIRSIWEVEDDPSRIKAKRRNFSSIKSSINADLATLSKKGLNSENIIITESNIFDMTEEAKSNLLSSFSDAVKTGGINLDQAADLLKAISDFLENLPMEKKDSDAKDIVSQIQKILKKMTEETLAEDDEEIEEIELADDEEIEEVEDGEIIELEDDQDIEDEIDAEERSEDEEIEEIELDEDEILEEIDGPDEDEEFQEVEDLNKEDEAVEEIELEDDETLEEVEDGREIEEDIEKDLEEVLLDEDIEEIELEEDQTVEEEIDAEEQVEDEEIEEIELNEDEILEEIDGPDEDEEFQEVEDLNEEDEAVEEIELTDDETIEEVEELDEDELKALEEFRQKKELAEHFDQTLGDREKKYNQYTTVPEGKYTIGTRKSLKSSLELQQFDMPKVYIGIYPVTNALFEIFIEETGYITTAEEKGFGRVFHSRFKKNETVSTWKKIAGSEDVKGAFWYQPTGPDSNLHGKRNHPVVQVSVQDAMAYASWIGRRLPTESEWEAAARTDLGYIYPWGDEFNIKALNIEQSGFSGTCAVDEYDAFANEFKIVDLLGNVMEWTSDMENSPFPSRKNISYCIAKGGAWNSKNDVTISSRGLFKPGFSSNTIGFRCISEIFI